MADDTYTIHTDGASRGNPGHSGIGYTIADAHGNVVQACGEYIGIATNNVAEYRALLRALEHAHEMGLTRVDAVADSQLMVRQLQGAYQVKNAHLLPLHAEATRLLSSFKSFNVQHVDRGSNQEADRLATQAIRDHLAASSNG